MGFPLPAGVPGGITPPSIVDWQWSFNGLTMGAATSFGITSIKGLALANIRSGDVALPRDSGELAGLDVYGGRDVTIDMWVTGESGLYSNEVALSTAMSLGLATEQPLWFQLPGMPLLCVMGRVRKRDIPWDANYAAGAVAKPSLQLHCTDPRIYTAAISTTINLGTVGGGGLGPFPVGPFPVTFGATTPAQAVITNSGTMESRPILVFNGPLTNPWVSNLTAPGSPIVQVSNPYQTSYTVLAGDQLLVDLNVPHRCLYYSGGIATGVTPSSVRYWLTFGSSWWNLPANTASVIEFGSQDSTATGGSVAIWAASAYQL